MSSPPPLLPLPSHICETQKVYGFVLPSSSLPRLLLLYSMMFMNAIAPLWARPATCCRRHLPRRSKLRYVGSLFRLPVWRTIMLPQHSASCLFLHFVQLVYSPFHIFCWFFLHFIRFGFAYITGIVRSSSSSGHYAKRQRQQQQHEDFGADGCVRTVVMFRFLFRGENTVVRFATSPLIQWSDVGLNVLM